MNKETKIVFNYYMKHLSFLEAIKELSFDDTELYMRTNLALDIYAELFEAQVDLFYAALNNVDWHKVINELEAKTVIKGWIKK